MATVLNADAETSSTVEEAGDTAQVLPSAKRHSENQKPQERLPASAGNNDFDNNNTRRSFPPRANVEMVKLRTGSTGQDQDDDEGLPGIVYKPTTLEGIRQGRIIDQLDELYLSSSNCCSFLRNMYHYILRCLPSSRIFWIAVISLSVSMALMMLTMGLIFVDTCPAEPCIPVFHIVGGCALLLIILAFFVECQARHKRKLTRPGSDRTTLMEKLLIFGVFSKLLAAFIACWFLTGCVWVYGNYSNVQYRRIAETDQEAAASGHSSTSARWCAPQLYEFSIWLISIIIVLLVLLTVAVIGLVLFLRLRKRS